MFDIDNNNPELYVSRDELGGKTVAQTLLTPTRIYVKPVLALLEKVSVHGISHITGGGFYENIPRSIPDGSGQGLTVPQYGCFRFSILLPRREIFLREICSILLIWEWG